LVDQRTVFLTVKFLLKIFIIIIIIII